MISIGTKRALTDAVATLVKKTYLSDVEMTQAIRALERFISEATDTTCSLHVSLTYPSNDYVTTADSPTL